VVNYDMPDVPENYVHRIGRTARAGAGGIAIAFCAPDEREELHAVEKLIRIKIPVSRCLGDRPSSAGPRAPFRRGPPARSTRTLTPAASRAARAERLSSPAPGSPASARAPPHPVGPAAAPRDSSGASGAPLVSWPA
jgi:ATP-dependent RNA helicase RhlE